MRTVFLLLLFFFFSATLSAHPDSSLQTTCTRNMVVTGNKIEVTLVISKPAKGGFARIYEKLPAGSTVSNVKCGKGIFKTEKSMLKIVWEDIPVTESLEITYSLKLSEAVSDTAQCVSGTFSAEFLTGTDENLSIGNGTLLYSKNKIIPDAAEYKNNSYEKDTPTVNTHANQQPLATDQSIYICIQVAAASYQVKEDYLSKTFGYPGEFESHFEDNVYRLTVGKYKTVGDAEAAMKEYKEKYFKKCFLSAYKNGHKISVNEAQRLLN